MKVWIKEPGKKPRRVNDKAIGLEWFKSKVGGYLEVYPVASGAAILCNEDGRLKDLPFNFTLLKGEGAKGRIQLAQDFVGTVVFVGLRQTEDGLVFDDFDRELPVFVNTLLVIE